MEENHFAEEPRENYNKEKDFTSLLCWQDARKMKLFFYDEVIPKLPSYEESNLKSQMRRASVSATANIAEGYGRYNYQDSTRFYRISRGSTFELKDHLISCLDLKYIGKELFDKGISLIENAKIKINGYIKYVQKLKNDAKK
jgi:four helix bundle protein